MSFLKDIMTPRRMLSNLSQEHEVECEESDDSSVVSIDPGRCPSGPGIDTDNIQSGNSSSDTSELHGSMPPPTERPLKKQRKVNDLELLNIEKEKLKLIERQISSAENHDDNYHFVMSLLPMMRKLSPEAQLRTRIKMQEVLLKEIHDQTSMASYFSSFSVNEEPRSSQSAFSPDFIQLR
ncbi:uncharacterized protein LOC106662930 [Cimex lectularius]|uniref:BESS domain-containing protein n=1 Tax=Cimex lectularius TaxID=79782 RepID=A0A8I6RCZ2_CIMLE|nr:uncharacterized protein LOC106662930 [Cimex lectularius]